MTAMEKYNEAVNFLTSLNNVSSTQTKRTAFMAKKRLNKIKAFLKILGSPQDKLNVIHIAGTSGKGSVALMLHSIFSRAGYKVGTYTSPHISTFSERIKVGNKYISARELCGLVDVLKDKLDSFAAKTGEETLNFFELSFCLAMRYFAEKKCDMVVLETGLGGKADPTNVIRSPLYTIITNIGRDHLDIFPSLKDIAYEKAGITKPGAPVLTGEKNRKWLAIFLGEAKKKKTTLKKIDYKKLRAIRTDLRGTGFIYDNKEYILPIPGAHQAGNAALAIECAADLGIKSEAIRQGIAEAKFPLRLEVVRKNPLIILDGAHNEDKLRTTVDFIKQTGATGKKHLIIGMVKSKKIRQSFFDLIGCFDRVYFTRFSNAFKKARGYGDWERLLAKNSRFRLYYKHCAKDALLDILPKLGQNDLLLITGSIYLAGELRKHWYKEEDIIKHRKSIF